MKKILLSLLIVFSIGNLYAQTVVNRAGAANTVQDARLKALRNLFAPAYNDTTAANVQKGVDSCGAVIFTYDNNLFWYRACSPKRWVGFGSGQSITNITTITVINDNSVEICNGIDACDTVNITLTEITNITTAAFLTDTTITVCNADAECETVEIPRQQVYAFQNGLTEIFPGIVEFGGTIVHATTLTASGVEALTIYLNGDIGIGNYPTTRIDPPAFNVLSTTSNGTIQSTPYVNQTRYGIVQGGLVTWVEDYDYNVSSAIYYINGAPYTSPDTTITLSPPDATYNRIDAFVVNEDGEVEVIEGTPSSNPSQPSIDPETQILLTFALVETGTTEPSDINSECPYQEGTEWTEASSTARINVASTTTPCGGTYSIEGTNVINGDYFTLTRSVAFDPREDNNALIFQIKSKGNWGNSNQNRRMAISWRGAGGIVGQNIFFANGSYGFNAANTSDCQTITIPLSNFFFPSTVSVTELRFSALSGNGSMGWYIDNICLQGGGGLTPPPTPQAGVSKFSNLLPLFTTSKPQPDSLLFQQIAQAANTVFAGPATGSNANPTFRALVAADIPALAYYNNVEQLTDTCFIIIRADNTRDTICVTKGSFYALNGLTKRNDSTVVLGSTPLDENTVIDGDNFSLSISGGRFETGQGVDIAAANDLTLGTDGNVFHITGNTQINAITTAGWQAGSVVSLIFTGTPTLKDNTAGGAGTAVMQLAGSTDFVAVVDDVMTLVYDGTDWHEVSRKLASTGGGGLYTVNNGLSASTANNFQLGATASGANSPLLHDTYINTTASYFLEVNGSNPASGGGIFKVTQTASTGYGVYAIANSSSNGGVYVASSAGTGVTGSGNIGVQGSGGSGTGVWGLATSGTGVLANTTSGTYALRAVSNPSSTNTVVSVAAFDRTSSGSAANGIGLSIELRAEVSDLTTPTSNQLISKWTDATVGTRTSQFIITGVNSGATNNLVTIDGAGTTTVTTNGASAANGLVATSTGIATGVTGNGFTGVLGVSSNSAAVRASATSTAVGLLSTSVDGLSLSTAVNPASTNSVVSIAEFGRTTSGTAANGIGGILDILVETTTGVGRTSNQLISKWVDVTDATRTSQMVITGVLSASTVDLLTLNANGSIQLRPITAAAASAITPAEGMILFVSDTDATFVSIGFWGYRNGAWAAF